MTGTLIGAFIIVLREVIEAGLIIGIVLAATKTISGRLPYIFGGIAAGVCGAGILAIFAGALSNSLQGIGQEVFNASILGIAAVMLAWHNIFMARHGRQMGAEIAAFGKEIKGGSRTLMALAIVIGVAVLREGSEVVLFLYGIVVSSGATGSSILLGGFLGLLAGAAISALTYRGLIFIPMRTLFKVTGLLISLMAAGMAAQAIAFLEQADLTNVLGQVVWNSSAILPDNSLGGRVLHTLLGYTDQPTELQLLVYFGTLAIIYGLMKVFVPPFHPRRPVAAE